MALFTSQIPFQYKCASIQGKTVIHPEFTTCGLSSSSPPAKPMPPVFLFPPPVSRKIMGINVCFFPQCPKIIGKPWDFSGFSYGLGIYLLFLCVCPKSTGILGIAGKNSLLCPGSETRGLKQGIGPRQRRTYQKSSHQKPKGRVKNLCSSHALFYSAPDIWPVFIPLLPLQPEPLSPEPSC